MWPIIKESPLTVSTSARSLINQFTETYFKPPIFTKSITPMAQLNKSTICQPFTNKRYKFRLKDSRVETRTSFGVKMTIQITFSMESHIMISKIHFIWQAKSGLLFLRWNWPHNEFFKSIILTHNIQDQYSNNQIVKYLFVSCFLELIVFSLNLIFQ